jgi:threonine dehydratase
LLDEKKVSKIDYVLVPSGGGALVSSIASFLKQIDPSIKIIAVEPSSCQPFADSLRNSSIIVSDTVSKFCHGSSVKKVG